MSETEEGFSFFTAIVGFHLADKVALASGGHNGAMDIWGFKTGAFVIADGITNVIHHNPGEEAGLLILGDEIKLSASAPENTGVDAKHGNDAVIFCWTSGEDFGFGWSEIIGKKLLDFGRVGDFVEEESAVGLNHERHHSGGFGGIFDKFLLKPDGKLSEFGLHIVGFADHHGINKLFHTFGVL